MIFAQILNGVIQNMIVLDDETLIGHFQLGFDACVRTDNLAIQPDIGWTYSNGVFFPPQGD